MRKGVKKRVTIGKPPKAFVGMAMAGAQAAMSIINGIKAKKEAKAAATEAERSALTQQRSQDKLELEDYPEEGAEGVNYYQAGGGKLGVRKRTEPTEKELNKKDVKSINDSTGLSFDKNSANQLFSRTGENTSAAAAPINYGKYKKVGYFETGNMDGDTVRIKNTAANPHNADTIKPVMDEIRKLNPGRNIALNFAHKAGGGKIKGGGSHDTIGGKLNPISSDMELAKGNTHESSKIDNTSGIKLIKGNKAVAEIEDDETVKDGNLVYSDRLKASNGKTFADNAERLAKDKGKAEKRLDMGDSISKNTAKRKVGMLDAAEDALFIEQEEFKKANGIEQGEKVAKANGGKILKAFGGMNITPDMMSAATNEASRLNGLGSGLDGAAPYVDNVVNGALSLFMTPKVPKPQYLKARKLNTTVNVNPELNSVNDAVNGASKTIMENTSNSNTARSNIASVRLKGAEQKGKIFASKENRENQLEDQNTQFQQRTEMINGQKREGFNRDNMAKQAHTKNEISANVANLSDDLVQAGNNKKDEAYNNEALAAFKTMNNNNNGTVERSDETMQAYLDLLLKNKRAKANGGKIKKK